MDKIIEKFLKLTDYTYIYGEEHELEKHLPDGILKDEAKNYYIKIGESETMFCSHLDTAAFFKEKVQHEFFKNEKGHLFLGTTGETVTRTYTNASGETITKQVLDSTLLGADDKAGVVIMLHMIENKIPGLYYFFLGEESGAIGSNAILRLNPTKFSEYKRCVAFDRRGYGSIISKQRGRVCCSEEFVDALAAEFKKNGMTYVDDKTGIFTDSATFMNTIPECTNLSVGYFNEHSQDEIQNLTYLIKLSKTVLGIDWESLPTTREPNPYKTKKPVRGKKGPNDLSDEDLEELFIDVDDVLEDLADMVCMNWDDFEPEREMLYSKRRSRTNDLSSIWIHEDGSITAGREKFDDLDEFRDAIEAYYKPKYRGYNFYDNDEYSGYGLDDPYSTSTGSVKRYNSFDNSTNSKGKKSKEDDLFDDTSDQYDFLLEVFNFLSESDEQYISPKEMQELLNKYNTTVEKLIIWLHDNREDYTKTYGLTWNDEDDVFEIQQP